jgi:putative addiction module killer protein
MEAQPREIKEYQTNEGKTPFSEWINSLQDLNLRVKIEKRLDRVALGNLGDYRSLGEGVYELKIDFGPGYRIYFGQIGLQIILLLCGGDKSSQKQDILKAKEYWKDYEKPES